MELNRKYVFLLVILILIMTYYIKKKNLIEYKDFHNLIINSDSNCANAKLEYEYLNKLSEIKILLNSMQNNVKSPTENHDLGIQKLSETLNKLQNIMNDHRIPTKMNELEDIKYHMKVYDLNKPNENEFECVKSRNIIVQTTICIHDIGRDEYVSGAIKFSGVWEQDLVEIFMRMLNSKKDLNVLDIGAQLGQYSLYAAKLGRKCISIEPFYDSYIRLHKSILIENLQDKFILLTNGLSDKRGELKKLQNVPRNVGGQTLLNDPNDYSTRKNETSIINDKYMIETILMDDIVEILPHDFKDCIMKIDIEGYEERAFRKASKLFLRLNVLAVFMEWAGILFFFILFQK